LKASDLLEPLVLCLNSLSLLLYSLSPPRESPPGISVVYYSNRCSLLLTAFCCILVHFNAFNKILLHSILMHLRCISDLLHAHAFICISTCSCRLHSGTMHLCAFTCITFVASQCIQYLVHLNALSCIYNTMHFHPLLHYHALGARDTFMCITVWMHSVCDAY